MGPGVPSIESRVRAQEMMQTIANARIEELSIDMTASFKQQAEHQIQFEQNVDARFNAVDARFNAVDARFNAVDARFNAVDARLDKIEATMATKEDLAAIEGRMLDAFKQLLSIIETRLPSANK